MSDILRQEEILSLFWFINDNVQFLTGDVLDYGSGKQPYRKIIQGQGANYHPYDRLEFPASRADEDVGTGMFNRHWDTILCTQVIQYIPDPLKLLWEFLYALNPGGHLVLTYPTHWPEVESEDLWRFTKAGMEKILKLVGFEILVHTQRFTSNLEGHEVAIGYGVVARAT